MASADFPESPDFLERWKTSEFAAVAGYSRELGHQEIDLDRNRLEVGVKGFWTAFNIGFSGAFLLSTGPSPDDPPLFRFLLMGRHNIL